jgi:hypothetical protein
MPLVPDPLGLMDMKPRETSEPDREARLISVGGDRRIPVRVVIIVRRGINPIPATPIVPLTIIMAAVEVIVMRVIIASLHLDYVLCASRARQRQPGEYYRTEKKITELVHKT